MWVTEHKNIWISTNGNDGDNLILCDNHDHEIDRQTNIEPGTRIIIQRQPGLVPEPVKIER